MLNYHLKSRLKLWSIPHRKKQCSRSCLICSYYKDCYYDLYEQINVTIASLETATNIAKDLYNIGCENVQIAKADKRNKFQVLIENMKPFAGYHIIENLSDGRGK